MTYSLPSIFKDRPKRPDRSSSLDQKDRTFHTEDTQKNFSSVMSCTKYIDLPCRYILSRPPINKVCVSCGIVAIYAPENKWLLVQRLMSIEYTLIVKGHYRRSELLFLLPRVSKEEKDNLLSLDYDSLWLHVNYPLTPKENLTTELDSKMSPRSRKSPKKSPKWSVVGSRDLIDPPGLGCIGVKEKIVRDRHFYHGQIMWYENFTWIKNILISISVYPETEFFFPKGRPNFDENNLVAAFRELHEETGLSVDGEFVSMTPILDRYTGINNILYENHLWVVKINTPSLPEVTNEGAKYEISNTLWVDEKDLDKYIRPWKAGVVETVKRMLERE